MNIIKLLPEHISFEVLEYLYPDVNTINFIKKNYNDKYEIAHDKNNNYISRQIDYIFDYGFIKSQTLGLWSQSNYMLSRIPKKSGSHRYYITTRIDTRICQGCGSDNCYSMYCRGGFDYKSYYSSKYIGKSLINAIIILTKL
jgi:hypothetical protein